MSTFHGLEMAKQALFTQQSALYTTGHNISNANTEGYSRQRVNFEALPGYPSPSRNSPKMAGQLGSGVTAGHVERIRDKFLDSQYRTQNSRAEYWATNANALSRMESLLNEMDESGGLSEVLDDFWSSLSDLAGNPQNEGTRKVVANNGLAVAETFQYLSGSLQSIRKDLKSQIGSEDGTSGKLGDANSLLRQIDSLNKEISEIEPQGHLANDLYDKRDRLIDELSGIVNIQVSYEKSSPTSLDIADGIAKIELVDKEGSPLDVVLLSKDQGPKEFTVTYDSENENAVGSIQYGDDEINIHDVDGSLKALVENYGFVNEDGQSEGSYIDMLQDLDKMATAFAEEFNKVHKEGYDLTGSETTSETDFFIIGDDGAASITVNKDILKNPDLIAVSANGETGNGDNAKKLQDVIDKALPSDALGKDTSVKEFFEGVIGELAVNTKEAIRQTENTDIQRARVENDRYSVSAVSLDEEVTNLLRFQHAYNAAARSMTATDELLDKVINSMGIVGR